ncbi:hypothetical protein [Devosia sp. 1566]|uniref:hypothetical protein n=1 Tax=Devosia sp. 1566 TaxID=2499144 RepID=UPI000FD90637|nr:hypothetical protein [Devosia sp. 1566]
MPTNHPGSILPQDTAPADAVDEVIVGQPISQDEVDDLLYGEDRPAGERVDRLRELADQIRARQAGDLATNPDTDPLLDEIDRAIAELSGSLADADDEFDYGNATGVLAQDPEDHLDALSPDDVDGRAGITGEAADSAPFDDDEDEPEPLDETEWEEGDGFDPDKGVR